MPPRIACLYPSSASRTPWIGERLLEGCSWLSFRVSVAGDDVDNHVDHFLLAFLPVVDEALVGGIVDGEIGVHPNLDVALLIDADLVLLDFEVLGVLVDLAEAFEGLHEDVEIVGIGDVADLADADLDVLDVDAGHEALRADLVGVVLADELGVDHVGLLVAPVEGLEVVVVLLLVRPDEAVLIDLFPSSLVPHRPELPEFLRNLSLLLQVLPVVGVELGSFDGNGLLAAH